MFVDVFCVCVCVRVCGIGWDGCMFAYLCCEMCLSGFFALRVRCNAGDINIQNATTRTVRSPVPSQSHRTEFPSGRKKEEKGRERQKKKKG